MKVVRMRFYLETAVVREAVDDIFKKIEWLLQLLDTFYFLVGLVIFCQISASVIKIWKDGNSF